MNSNEIFLLRSANGQLLSENKKLRKQIIYLKHELYKLSANATNKEYRIYLVIKNDNVLVGRANGSNFREAVVRWSENMVDKSDLDIIDLTWFGYKIVEGG